jgi:flagellar FliL protein
MSKNVIIIIIAVFVLLMGMMGAGFYLLWSQMTASIAQVQMQNGTSEEEAEAEAQEEKIGTMYRLDTLIVNLADHGGKRYLRVTMELELKPNEDIDAAEVVEEIEKRMPQLRDTILMILPSKQYADISTTTGKIALRDELMEKLNGHLKTGLISTIYFTEFVIQ